jgi:hypothetical protein
MRSCARPAWSGWSFSSTESRCKSEGIRSMTVALVADADGWSWYVFIGEAACVFRSPHHSNVLFLLFMPLTGSAVTAPAADHRRLSANRRVPRPLRLSLSLGSFGVSSRLVFQRAFLNGFQ